MSQPSSLDALSARVQHDLELLNYPSRVWVNYDDDITQNTTYQNTTYNVIIVGAGQAGLATAFGLRRQGIAGVLVLDDNPEGKEGPWETYARMETLRTPKEVTGPDLGIPSLTFRAWYEAQFGEAAWHALGKIPKGQWMDYLRWYKQVLSLPVRNDAKVVQIIPPPANDEVFTIQLENGKMLRAKRVVWATGMAGGGTWVIPEFITKSLPKDRYAHTAEDINFDALKGKRVAVLGAGASAFDNAATALEQGAAKVHLCFRRRELPRINPYRWMEFSGFLQHQADLPDAERWAFTKHILDLNQPPPQETFLRTAKHAGFHLHPGSQWQTLTNRPEGISIDVLRLDGARYSLEVDFVIVGTGFEVNLDRRPELANIAPDVARWADCYTPPTDLADDRLGQFPYLGKHFEWTARRPGSAPYLRYLYDITFGALPSMGLSGASISGLGFAVPRLVRGIAQSFYTENSQHFYEALTSYDEPELTADVSSVIYEPEAVVMS